MGMTIPEQYGGAGADTVSYAIAVEELTRVDSSVAITVAAHHSLGTLPIYYYGNDAQKEQWLPDLTSGKKLAAFGLTDEQARLTPSSSSLSVGGLVKHAIDAKHRITDARFTAADFAAGLGFETLYASRLDDVVRPEFLGFDGEVGGQAHEVGAGIP